MTTTDETLRQLMAAYEFFRCPHTNEVLMGDKSDDKVMCGCGRGDFGHPAGLHFKRFLTRATVDDYLRQKREADEPK